MRRARRNYGGRTIDRSNEHIVRIARDTLKMTDKEAGVSEYFGGMSKEEARRIVHDVAKHPDDTETVRSMKSMHRTNPQSSIARTRSELASGLKVWVMDYVQARKSKNPKEAKRLRDAIQKVIRSKNLHAPTVWGLDPERPRRRNPSKRYVAKKFWNSKKSGGKADGRSFRTKKLKRGGLARFACPKGRWSPRKKRCKSAMKLYELLIPRGSRRRSKK